MLKENFCKRVKILFLIQKKVNKSNANWTAMVIFDIQNTFNTASWKKIAEEPRNKNIAL